MGLTPHPFGLSFTMKERTSEWWGVLEKDGCVEHKGT